MKIPKIQQEKLLSQWKSGKKILQLATTFVGSFQLVESEKLKTVNPKAENPQSLQSLAEGDDKEPVLPTEVQPVEEDFVEVTYRALSATLLHDRPIDFSNTVMLKKSVSKLKGQTVFKDHETSVDNWVGRVKDAEWDNKTEGFPPGINAVMRLDAVKDPMTVRGVVQGAIHSASVTVSFEWEPSHPDLMETNTFFQFLGEEVNGEMVRIVVTEILKFWEISLVWQGADQFAKQIDEEGNPVGLAANSTEELNSNSQQKIVGNQLEEEMKLEELLKKLFGTDVSVENLEAKIAESSKKVAEPINAELATVKEAQAKATQDLADKDIKLTEASSKIQSLEKEAELGRTFLKGERDEAIRLYKLAAGEGAKEAIIKSLETSDLTVVQAWKAEFSEQVEQKMPATCTSCGKAAKFTRQTSKQEDVNPKNESPTLSTELATKVQDLHS